MFYRKKKRKASVNEKLFQNYEAATAASTCSPDVKNTYLHVLSASKNGLSNTEGFKAIIGFDDEDAPILWDMAKGNLLAAASMGTSMDYLSCCLPIFSMALRFSPDEFQFFYLSDDCYSLAKMFPESCRGESCRFTNNKNEICGKIVDELQYRSRLERNELKKEPFLLIAIGNPYMSTAGAEKHLVDKMFELLMTSAQRLRCAVMLMSTRFEVDPYYCFYKESFPFVLLGLCDETHSFLFTGTCDASRKDVMRASYPWGKEATEEKRVPRFYGIKCFFINEEQKQLIHSSYIEIAECLYHKKDVTEGEVAE